MVAVGRNATTLYPPLSGDMSARTDTRDGGLLTTPY